jgi:plastocyanin
MRSRSRRNGSVLIALVALVAVLAMFTPSSAVQSFVVAGPGNAASPVYYTPFVVLQRGQALNFVNLDIAPHDVRSPTGLFFSKIITIGKKTPVVGVKNLKKGSYKFYCSIHPIMKGTLRVI